MTEFNELRRNITAIDRSISIHKKFPLQIFIGVFWMALIAGMIALNLKYELPLTISILSSLIIGIAFSVLNFFNHELLHGSMTRSLPLMRLMSYPGFFILCLSAELWRTWHNQLHHFNTNQLGGVDPDLAGDWDRLKNRKLGKLILKMIPGWRSWPSYIAMPVIFSAQCINVTWVRSRERPKLYSSMSRKRVVTETLIYYLIWAVLLFTLSFQHFFFLFLIPMGITNIVIINYVGLPHNMRPLSQDNKPLLTAISLKSPWILDLIFFNFGHHCEHHVFPEANHTYLPRVRKILLKEYPHDFHLVTHWKALQAFYKTPRAYLDHDHLFDPTTLRKVNLTKLAETEFS
ncbi:MAG: fatty acid desaturase [Xanthomonadaceae bacterium]|nr:fatty acid desaturase [Xanthomonadaceae bacterium]